MRGVFRASRSSMTRLSLSSSITSGETLGACVARQDHATSPSALGTGLSAPSHSLQIARLVTTRSPCQFCVGARQDFRAPWASQSAAPRRQLRSWGWASITRPSILQLRVRSRSSCGSRRYVLRLLQRARHGPPRANVFADSAVPISGPAALVKAQQLEQRGQVAQLLA